MQAKLVPFAILLAGCPAPPDDDAEFEPLGESAAALDDHAQPSSDPAVVGLYRVHA